MIAKQWTLRSVVLRYPHLAKTLDDLGLQPSQGYLTIEAAASRLRTSPEALVAELTQATGALHREERAGW